MITIGYLKGSNTGLENEDAWVKFIQTSLSDGICNFVFKGVNGCNKVFKNIVAVEKQSIKHSRKKDGFALKADIYLVNTAGMKYPISIKKSNSRTSWESADFLLKNHLRQFIKCYGRFKIPPGIRIKVEDDRNINLDMFVFGDDIITNNGIILVQTMSSKLIHYKYSENTLVMSCERVFFEPEHVYGDNDYRPAISIRKDKSRNLTDELLAGYRIEVVTNHCTTNILSLVEEDIMYE